MKKPHGNKGRHSKLRGRGRCMAWLLAHADYRHDDCLKWPFSRDSHGYGQLGFEGKVLKAHRKLCELKHGPAPSPDHEAAHSCGRGHQGCVNQNHLSWKTRSENQQDRTDTYNRGCPRRKLTDDDVALIRTLFPTTTNLEIAKRFDVTPGLISKIKNGHLWTDERKYTFIPVSDEIVREIKALFGKKTTCEIAEQFGLPEQKIYRIKRGSAHGHVCLSGEQPRTFNKDTS